MIRLTIRSLILVLLFNFISLPGISAQNSPDSSASVIIGKISIFGNKITKAPVIMRELSFATGDTIPAAIYNDKMTAARENVFNTKLFNFVTVDSSSVGGKTDINIRVVERWYIWPWPYFEISDRNFNSWIKDMDFSRLTYGIDFTFQNVRGRNETIKIPVHLGFNQKYGLLYQIPYLNKKKTLGAEFGALYERNHEVVVTSKDNKPVWYKENDSYPQTVASVSAGLMLRRGIYVRHTFLLAYSWFSFSDSLAKIPNYSSSMSSADFPSFYYQLKSDHRDVHYYPLKGYYIDFELVKYGFWNDIDELSVKTNLRKYWRLHNRWHFATGLTLKASLTGATDIYFLQKGLGYGRDFVRGYEYYVIDGQQYGILKNNLKFSIVPQRVITINALKSRKFNTIPWALYMNVFTDLGFVNNRSESMNKMNDMENTLLVGYGAGIDLTTYYDIVIRVDAAVNGRGEAGIYLHFMAPI